MSSSGSNQLRSAPFGFEYTGVYTYDNGSFGGGGSRGYYWSRSASSHLAAILLYFDSGSVYPGSNNRGNGYAVRCGAR